MSIINEYLNYHNEMIQTGDMDPAYGALRYVCDRFELNIEQKFWLAYVYSACYCGSTTFYIYNEFPDYEQVNLKAVEKWWGSARGKVLFQSDRRWVRSRNQFTQMIASYKTTVGQSQFQFFNRLKSTTPNQTYDKAYKTCGQIFQMGRFGLFIYLEAVRALTDFPLEPTGLDLAYSESSRNGLCYAIGRKDLITGKETGRKQISASEMRYLQSQFKLLEIKTKNSDSTGLTNVWNIETSLCAFKKYKRTQEFPDTPKQHRRYIGYYLDRQADEIEAMEKSVPSGVCWDVLWQYRREKLKHEHLKELK